MCARVYVFNIISRTVFIYCVFNPGAVTETNTVLRYGPRETPSDYARADFVPFFVDELSQQQRQAAQSTCEAHDTACVYDYTVSGSHQFARMSRDTRDSAVKANVDVSK